MVKKRTTPSFTDDEVKDAILRNLYERRTNATGMDSVKAGIMDLRSAMKAKGIGREQVIRNLLYLIEYGWITKEVEQGQIRRGGSFFPTKTEKYMITNQGMEQFEEKSKYSRPSGIAGINIDHVSGVVNIGDNNIIRNESMQLNRDLEELENRTRLTDQLSDEQKVNYRADIKTIQSQLAKTNPDKGIISKAWGALKFVGTIGSVSNVWHKVKTGLEQAFGSMPQPT